MNEQPKVLVADSLASPARHKTPTRPTIRVACVQESWRGTQEEQIQVLTNHANAAARHGVQVLCFPEITLSPYLCFDSSGPNNSPWKPEPLKEGITLSFARDIAKRFGMYVVASLYEQATDGGLGFNTAITVAPTGELILKQRKTHLPITAGYFEDKWFRPAESSGYQIATTDFLEAKWGTPTCWDQWFPELARLYGLTGTDILIYPTAIGSEPDFPEFDTAPIWQKVMMGHAIVNGLFVIAPNRVGQEGPNYFYGNSFIVDPYGRILIEAGRFESALLVADIDLDTKRDWLELFPFFSTRRPNLYDPLTQ